MNEFTPPQNKFNQELINNDTPLEDNKYNDIDLLNLKEEEKKFKTISHLKQYNNISNENLNNISQKLFDNGKEKTNFLNNTASIINNNENINEKINFKLKIKSTPKNRKLTIPEEQEETKKIKIENKNNILSKSSNNMTKFKKQIKNRNIIMTENNQNKAEDEDSVNLSALAEDLLSMSDENVQIMRKGPINKNDFIGESKELYNIYKKQGNKIVNMNMNKNKINIDSINPMPKLQTKLYSSPLDKFNIKNNNNHINNIKNSNKKNYNNIETNLYNFNVKDRNNQYNKNQIKTQITAENSRAYPSMVKNHISSNSIKNNTNINNNININVNINSNNNNNNTILSNLITRNQAIKNSYNGNNDNQLTNDYDMFSKTGLNQYNTNYLLDFDETNLNNFNKIINNHSVGKKKLNLNLNIKNNSNSNRNIKNKSIAKQINSLGLQNNLNSSNEYINKSNLNINSNTQYYNNPNKNITLNRANININNANNMNNKLLNTNYQQNINLLNNNNNYNTNINYNNKSKNKNFSLNSQIFKKAQTSNYLSQNANPKLNNINNNNIERKHKNPSNINMNQRSVLINHANKYNNNYNIANKLDYVSSIQNKAKNIQVNKILRKSDYHKFSNKNILYDLNEQEKNLINNNNANNQQINLDKNSNLIKGKNKNSYTNIYNYLDMNNNKIRKNNNFYNNNDMNSQKLANTFHIKNYAERGYLNENVYTYNGQNETVDYIDNNYLNKRIELSEL